MKNSVSDRSFYIESEDDDDEERDNRHIEDGNDSDFSGSEAEQHRQQQFEPSSYNTQWPQSYRQSIDLYTSVPSPSIGFLGTPLSRLGSSFLSSSFLSSSVTRRHTPETLPFLAKPPVPTFGEQQQQQQERPSSHSLHSAVPSRRSSIRKDDKSRISYDHHPMSRHSSFAQAVVNGINVLCGVGILSTPYAIKEGGWIGLSILLIFAVLSFYTGLLLRYCLDSQPGLQTYPDIGQAAFGTPGRIAISIILYVELYASCIEYIILEGDNLSSLFPHAHMNLGGFELKPHVLFAILTTLAVLPTVWLRDLSVLSYISAGGVVATILVVLCLFWVGLVDDVGFESKGTPLNLATLPVAMGLYGFCYSGHAVFPNIYTSLEKPNQYPAILLTCFCICTFMYAGVAVVGYTMFGEATSSQFTLNMPQDLVASKIAVWSTVVNPFTKYALTISPVAMSLEELVPSDKSLMYSFFIRTGLVISTLVVGLCIPFFGLMLSLIGSLFTMLVALILPCACYLSILKGRVTRFQMILCIIIIIVGVIASVVGTYSAVTKIIQSLSS
ncbi:amino acid transporter AVT1C-like [Argentina anserina]|uniref:amino acid transporter AVT1C-like n=1 Tax=Argentina anserina TaxID=57926 RepID=UPI0021765814|nr:amino acid transporter AVT1C-like [Potentilla anserina]